MRVNDIFKLPELHAWPPAFWARLPVSAPKRADVCASYGEPVQNQIDFSGRLI
jgi:hypothetical protein